MYYNPEKYGLTVVGTYEHSDEPYEFHTTEVVVDDDAPDPKPNRATRRAQARAARRKNMTVGHNGINNIRDGKAEWVADAPARHTADSTT